MSLADKLLNSSPAFVKHAKEHGLKPDVKTTYEMGVGPSRSKSDGYALTTRVTAYNTTLTSIIYVDKMPGNPRPTEQDARGHSVQESLEWARSLQERGLEVTIDGTNPEDVKDI